MFIEKLIDISGNFFLYSRTFFQLDLSGMMNDTIRTHVFVKN